MLAVPVDKHSHSLRQPEQMAIAGDDPQFMLHGAGGNPMPVAGNGMPRVCRKSSMAVKRSALSTFQSEREAGEG
jgi:hypothetical protein